MRCCTKVGKKIQELSFLHITLLNLVVRNRKVYYHTFVRSFLIELHLHANDVTRFSCDVQMRRPKHTELIF